MLPFSLLYTMSQHYCWGAAFWGLWPDSCEKSLADCEGDWFEFHLYCHFPTSPLTKGLTAYNIICIIPGREKLHLHSLIDYIMICKHQYLPIADCLILFEDTKSIPRDTSVSSYIGLMASLIGHSNQHLRSVSACALPTDPLRLK